MKLSTILSFVVLATALVQGTAQASLYTGTFNVSVYNGSGGDAENAPASQANSANPLLGGLALYTGTYTGAINFNTNGTDNILAFFTSGGGFLSGDTSALNIPMSASGFSLATVVDITWTYGGALSGTINHDDGVTLYDNNVAVTPADAAKPTTLDATAFSAGGGGDYRLIYVATNGDPSILNVEVVPEASAVIVWTLLGLTASGVAAYRRKIAV